jgi:hypothetical protein
MQQQQFGRLTRRLAIVLGAASLAGVGLVVVACGTDNGDAVATATFDAGTRDTGTKAEGGPVVDPDGGVIEAGADADCSKNPKLRQNDTGFFCKFKPVDAGAEAGANCGNNETCCNPSDKVGADFAPSFCATGKDDTACKTQAVAHQSTFDGGSAWACADKSACGAGEVCCLIQDVARLPKTLNIGSTPASDKNHPVACGAKTAYNAGGTRCRATCAAGEEKMCSLTDDTCGPGTKCTAFEGFFRDLGYCAPAN